MPFFYTLNDLPSPRAFLVHILFLLIWIYRVLLAVVNLEFQFPMCTRCHSVLSGELLALLWVETRVALCCTQLVPFWSNITTMGHGWVPQLRLLHLCENVFKKRVKKHCKNMHGVKGGNMRKMVCKQWGKRIIES